jgi:hypothetical protein
MIYRKNHKINLNLPKQKALKLEQKLNGYKIEYKGFSLEDV